MPGRAGAPVLVLTQAAPVAHAWAGAARRAGLATCHVPLLRVQPADNPALDDALADLARYRRVFVSSPTAVSVLAGRLADLGARLPAALRVAVPGPGTAVAMRRAFGDGVVLDQPPGEPHDVRHLLRTLPAPADDAAGGATLVLVRRDGRTAWIDLLRARGGRVDVRVLYDASPCDQPSLPASRLPPRPAFVVGAASQLDTLRRWLDGPWAAHSQRVLAAPLFVPHATVAAHATALGHLDVRVYSRRADVMVTLQSARTDANEDAKALTSDPTPKIPPAGPVTGPGSLPSTPASVTSADPVEPVVDAAVHDAGYRDSGGPDSGVRDAGLRDADHRATVLGAGPGADRAADHAHVRPSPPAHDRVRPASDRTHEPFADRVRDDRPYPPPAAQRTAGTTWPWWVLLLLLVGTVGVSAWLTQDKFHAVERDGDRRVQELAARTQDYDARIRSVQDGVAPLKAEIDAVSGRVGDVGAKIGDTSGKVADLAGRLGQLGNQVGSVDARLGDVGTRLKALDARVGESTARQDKIDALYGEIMRARTGTALGEAQVAVANATRYLQLQSNVPGAIAILQDGASVLNAADPADSTGVRKLMLADVEKLKAVPAVDMAALAVKVDFILDAIPKMPMMAEAKDVPGRKVDIAPEQPARAPAAKPETPPDGTWQTLKGWVGQAVDAGARGVDAARTELKDVVTIQKVDQPDLLLLGPQQRSLARDNLTLMMLNARLDLLNHRQALFRTDVERAAAAIRQVFDERDDTVRATLAALDELKSAPVEVEVPSLAQTAASIARLKTNSEKPSR